MRKHTKPVRDDLARTLVGNCRRQNQAHRLLAALLFINRMYNAGRRRRGVSKFVGSLYHPVGIIDVHGRKPRQAEQVEWLYSARRVISAAVIGHDRGSVRLWVWLADAASRQLLSKPTAIGVPHRHAGTGQFANNQRVPHNRRPRRPLVTANHQQWCGINSSPEKCRLLLCPLNAAYSCS